MKLKYYLRGLGIGMIVTALILGISFSNRQDQTSQIMTDDQIRERAAELGMVDSSELTLAALQNSAKQPTEGTPEETTQTQEQNNIEAEPAQHGTFRCRNFALPDSHRLRANFRVRQHAALETRHAGSCGSKSDASHSSKPNWNRNSRAMRRKWWPDICIKFLWFIIHCRRNRRAYKRSITRSGRNSL